MRPRFRGRLRVEFTNDPETPVMVIAQRRGRFLGSATYHCALDNGLDEVELTDAEMRWLADMEPEATAHFDRVRATDPDWSRR